MIDSETLALAPTIAAAWARWRAESDADVKQSPQAAFYAAWLLCVKDREAREARAAQRSAEA